MGYRLQGPGHPCCLGLSGGNFQSVDASSRENRIMTMQQPPIA